MSGPDDLDGLIPFLLEHILCTGSMDADVESINPHLARVWVSCAACDASYEQRFIPRPSL